MMESTFDKEFLRNEAGLVIGISTGYDYVGQHYGDLPSMRAELGIQLPEYPSGVDDFLVKTTPDHLVFGHFKATVPGSKKKYPAAYLGLVDAARTGASPEERFAKALASQKIWFYPAKPDEADSTKDAHSIVAFWDQSQFAIAVRGPEAIAFLERLHTAMKNGNVAVGLPRLLAFLRSGVSFIIASELTPDERRTVSQKFSEDRVLQEAGKASGLAARLAAAGIRVHALAPRWRNPQQSEVKFYINPIQQDRHNSGNFSISEIDDFIAGLPSPFSRSESLKMRMEAVDCRDVNSHLIRHFREQETPLWRTSPWYWLDEPQGVIGLNLDYVVGGQIQFKTLTLTEALDLTKAMTMPSD